MATLSDVRRVALTLPRTTEGLVREYVKFRIGPIVYASVSPDDRLLGFGYPKDQRAALVESDPVRFALPRPSDLRYNWAVAELGLLQRAELAEILLEAWCIVVSAKTSRPFLDRLPGDWAMRVYSDPNRDS